jgi:DNA invertase Pin-like site-specific DNA recombinase
MAKSNNGRAILYARFSPRPDAAECESCDRQLADLRAWCQRHALVTGPELEFRDDALSGGDERPGLADAVKAIRPGDVLLVRSWDRLFRDLRLALVLEFDVGKRGGRIQSITEDNDALPAALRELMRNLFLAIADYQRKVTRHRTKTRMRQHQANGRRMSLHPPYGWEIDPNSPLNKHGRPGGLRPVPDEQRVIDAIVKEYQLSVRLRELGQVDQALSPDVLAHQLNQARVPARGRRWCATTVRKILRRAGQTP